METPTEVHYTTRELEIIKLLLMGFNRKKAGELLVISTETVNSHIKHMMLKTDCHSIEDLCIYLLTHDFTVNPERTVVTYNGTIL